MTTHFIVYCCYRIEIIVHKIPHTFVNCCFVIMKREKISCIHILGAFLSEEGIIKI